MIKGAFKDHLVDWVGDYSEIVHPAKKAKEILADIDHRCVVWLYSEMLNLLTFVRIATAPLFLGLRRFPEGRGFKQWTGDDFKALMKVCPCL